MTSTEHPAQRGFTLVEVMIALLIGGVVMAAVMTTFRVQHNTYLAQDQVVEMQQNLRVAMDMLAREIRSAGFDPTGNSGAGITIATVGRLGFTRDLNADEDTIDPNETMTFGFSATFDADVDGIIDSGVAPLGLNRGGGFQPVAENFQALEFVYLVENGNDMIRTLTPNLGNIRGVQISLLARAAVADPRHTDSMQYLPASMIPLEGWADDTDPLDPLPLRTPAELEAWGGHFENGFNDGFRRRLLIQTVMFRNLGL